MHRLWHLVCLAGIMTYGRVVGFSWKRALGVCLRETPLRAIRHRPTKLKDWEVVRDVDDKTHGHGRQSKGKRGQPTECANSTSTVQEAEPLQEAPTEIITGLVLERYGDRLLVEITRGAQTVPIVCCQRSKMMDTTIVVGDVVELFLTADKQGYGALPPVSVGATQTNEFQGVVMAHQSRQTLLQRPVTSGSGNGIRQMKSIAANVDHVMVVVAASPHVPPSSIDRILVAAHEYGMGATIILNKVDDMEGSAEMRRQLDHYPKIGYTVLEVSMREEIGLDTLKRHLKDKCSIFVGQSGVGKSSLVNSILPDVSHQKIGALVKNTNIGSHTTSSARLFHLEGGGSVIDSPGIRELGVWHLSDESIKAGFFEIVELSKDCKFRNCQHNEDSLGCAVQKALKEGAINHMRFTHMRSLLK